MAELDYPGGELEVFAHARRWKAYWRRRIEPFVRGDVLEVGAGIGANTIALQPLLQTASSWVCLEPDPQLATRCEAAVAGRAEVAVGTLADLDPQRRFDTILYLDVLEHIQDDRAEVEAAASSLRPGGRLVVLAPAHPWLFSPFDRAIGHFRRYTRASLAGVAPAGLRLESLQSLDAVGLIASAANRFLLRQEQPSHAQIQTWDRLLVPLSRWLIDPVSRRRLGKSVLAVWQA